MSVENGGLVLKLTVQWPSVMLDMPFLHSKWLKSQNSHIRPFKKFDSQFLAFEAALRGLRERVTDVIESASRFPLLFPVETHVNSITPLSHSESVSRVFYVTLRAYAESYTVVNNATEFTEI